MHRLLINQGGCCGCGGGGRASLRECFRLVSARANDENFSTRLKYHTLGELAYPALLFQRLRVACFSGALDGGNSNRIKTLK